MSVKIVKEFKPLFKLFDENELKEVDTVICTGGRNSFKSYTLSIFALIGACDYGWRVLYSRFTGTSISDSIRSEIESKIELLNLKGEFKENRYSLESKNGGYISFKGQKTASKGQTANLKSLSNFNLWITDEADEIPSWEAYNKVYLSIRSIEKRNLSVFILNPTAKTHWIYSHFFAKRNVPAGFNGIKGNVMYIHTSYLSGDQDLIPQSIKREFEQLKEDDIELYNNIVLGGWIEQPDGVLFPKKDLNYYGELPKEGLIAKLSFIDVADAGDDYHSVPIGYVYDDGKIFIDDVIFTKESMTINVPMSADILNHHKVDYCRIETNFGGNAYIMLLQPLVKNTELLPAKATSNKHSRILTSQYRIKKSVYFRSDYEKNTMYHEFMLNMFGYMKDGTSDHDDAPDSIEGLVQFAQSLFSHLY